MSPRRQRIDIVGMKFQLERKIGRQKANKYFTLLSRFLNSKVKKLEFQKSCIGLFGIENVDLHNSLIRAILGNAAFAKFPPQNYQKSEVPKRYHGNLQTLCREVCPKPAKKFRTPTLRDRKFKDRPSPLGPNGKIHPVQDQQIAAEILSPGRKPTPDVICVEEGEDVEQASGSPGIYSRSPVRAPFGISISRRETRKLLCTGLGSLFFDETCQSCGEMPDTDDLKRRLERKLEADGLKISDNCANLLNNGLNVFMKRLIKPCLELANSRSTSVLNGSRNVEKPNTSLCASMFEFRTAMELNPSALGEGWPITLEKICIRESEESIGQD